MAILRRLLAAVSAIAVLALACTVQAASQPLPIRVLSVTRTPWGALDNVHVDRVMYTNDGLSLEAFVALPLDSAGLHPIIVVLHGGGGLGDLGNPYVTHVPFGQPAAGLTLLERRYPHAIVLAPEYRGFMQSGGHPGMPEAEASDARAAIRIAVRDFHGNGRAVYLLGYSIGGEVALAMAGQMPGIRAVVGVSADVGFDIEFRWAAWEVNTDKDPTFGAAHALNIEYAYIAHFGGTPGQVPKAYATQSPDTHIARITAPVLLLQGTADELEQWQAPREFANKLARAGKTVKFVLYPGGHHGLHTPPYQVESNAQIFAWFARAGLG